MTVEERLGAALLQYLARNKGTVRQSDVAKHCGVGQGAVSKWKKSRAVPQEHLHRIAELVGVKPEQLIENTEDSGRSGRGKYSRSPSKQASAAQPQEDASMPSEHEKDVLSLFRLSTPRTRDEVLRQLREDVMRRLAEEQGGSRQIEDSATRKQAVNESALAGPKEAESRPSARDRETH